MPHQFDPRHLGHLDNPIRRFLMPPKRTLRKIGLAKGDVFIDIGAGSGFFSFPASEIVGSEGEVLAVDIAPEAVALIERKCRERGTKNLRAIRSGPSGLGLAEAEATLAFMHTVLHEVEDKPGMLRAVHRALKAGGRIVVVEFGPGALFGPPREERIIEGEALALLAEAGFEGTEARRLGPSLYAATGAKPGRL
jgi:ubiquinone/menaquinone biosynthesis C-methylase UbiE